MSDLTSDQRVAELERENAILRAAHKTVMVERDWYKSAAELNADTIKNMVSARSAEGKGEARE